MRGDRVELVVLGVAIVVEAHAAGRAVAHHRGECGFGVGHRAAPAEQVQAGVALFHLREVGGARLRMHLHLHPDLRPHAGQGDADFLVVDVAVVRAVQRHFEAAGVAGLGHQLLRRGHVVGVTLLDLGVVERGQRRRCHAAGGHALVVHQLELHRLDVDRLVQRLAHPHILERVFVAGHVGVQQLVAALVHADEDDAVLGPVDNLHAAGGAQPGDVARCGVEHEVDLAGDERGQAGGVVADRGVHHILHIAFDFSPVVRVALEGGFDARLAADQHVRPGAVGVERGVAFFLVLEVQRLDRPVLLAPGLAHDPQRVQVLQEHRVDLSGLEVDGELVHLLRRAHRVCIGVHLRGGRLAAQDREHHVVGGHR